MIPTASPLVFRVEWELVYSSPPPPPVAGPSDGSSRYSPTWQQQRDVAATTFALAVGWRADGVEYGIASDLRTTARGSIWAAPAAASTPTVQQIVFWPPGRVPAEIPAVFRLCVRGSSSSASSSASGLGSSSATAGGTVGPAPSLRVRLVVLRSGAVLVAAASRLFNATATASLVQRARGAPAAAAPQHDPCTTTSAGLIATFPWAPAPPPPPSHSVSGAAGGAPPSSAAARAYAASLAAALRGGYSAGAASAPSAPSPLPPPADLQLPSSAAGPDPTSHAGTAMNGGGGVEGVRARLNHSSRGDEAGVDRLVAAGGAAAAAEAAAAGQEEARARRVRVALCVLGPIAAVGVAAVAMALGMRLLRSRRPKAGVEAAGDGQQSAAATAVDQDAAAHPTAAATTLGGEDDIIIAGSHGGAAGPAADASAGTFSGDESA
ncbi:hypothetical protein HXX76_002294 [Chlamydomonas incerta]|uniref:Uncharacterized protein n=1 Tax=Chlamydomonas incerta TaxID=51695 RepID=A0A835WAV8_CHLIN|nr:hypothetical protein HXX76_002294 [Chlamydomonas incerta]|eukprot:KAG2443955.1 hypothetical protein HXX76_002294 [Chlamydomonas incerta]